MQERDKTDLPSFLERKRQPPSTPAQQPAPKKSRVDKKPLIPPTPMPMLHHLLGKTNPTAPTPMKQHLDQQNVLPTEEQHREEVVVIGVMHCLGTEASWVDALIHKLDIKPENIFIMGKHYSSYLPTIEKLRDMGVYAIDSSSPEKLGEFAATFDQDLTNFLNYIEEELKKRHNTTGFVPFKIIFRDDGGKLITHPLLKSSAYLSEIPPYGQEQTQRGEWIINAKKTPCDYVLLPKAKLKRNIEPELIAKSVMEKVEHLLATSTDPEACYGISGLGHIGKAVAEQLRKMGKKVVYYDKDETIVDPSLERVTKEELFKRCSYIFGCSGNNAFAGMKLEDTIQRDITLVSCSSEDIEFNGFLKELAIKGINPANKLADIDYTTEKGYKLKIHYGGFPCNFGGKDPIVAEDIAITRGGQMGAFYQALVADPAKHSARGDGCNGKEIAYSEGIDDMVIEEFKKTHPSMAHS